MIYEFVCRDDVYISDTMCAIVRRCAALSWESVVSISGVMGRVEGCSGKGGQLMCCSPHGPIKAAKGHVKMRHIVGRNIGSWPIRSHGKSSNELGKGQCARNYVAFHLSTINYWGNSGTAIQF